MSNAQFHCTTHDAPIYDHAHVLEHELVSRGSCDVTRKNPEVIETPENSHFDLDD